MATSIQLSPDDERMVTLLAKRTGRSEGYYLREIVERGLEDIEDYYLAADVLERVRRGQEQVHSAADVRLSLRWTIEYANTAQIAGMLGWMLPYPSP